MAALLSSPQGAFAGEGRPGFRVGGQRTHVVSHRTHRHALRMRTHRRGSALIAAGQSTTWPHPAASSGVMLGSGRPGPRIVHVGAGHVGAGYAPRRDWRFARKHHRRHRSGTALVIVVGDKGAGEGPRLSGSEPLLEGPCKPGAYCTMRLGPYANSPKIITLNRSGKTIAE